MKEKARENMQNALITSAFFRLFFKENGQKRHIAIEEYLEGEFNKSVNNDGEICDAE